MDDYITRLKYLIIDARQDIKMAEGRLQAFEEALNEYETMLTIKENEKIEG